MTIAECEARNINCSGYVHCGDGVNSSNCICDPGQMGNMCSLKGNY